MAHLAAKNRFSRGFILVQKGVSLRMQQNEYLFKQTAIRTHFGAIAAKCSAIWYKTQCILVLNTVRFGAKCLAFWCKTQGKMVQNAVQNAAKRRAKSIKIHCNGINKTP